MDYLSYFEQLPNEILNDFRQDGKPIAFESKKVVLLSVSILFKKRNYCNDPCTKDMASLS